MSRKHSLDALAREELDAASRAPARRASRTVVGGHERSMRQTLVALLADETMAEHKNPGEATVYVVRGRVEVRAGAEAWEGRSGDLLEIPPERHSLHALEDSAVLLTVVLRGRD